MHVYCDTMHLLVRDLSRIRLKALYLMKDEAISLFGIQQRSNEALFLLQISRFVCWSSFMYITSTYTVNSIRDDTYCRQLMQKNLYLA